MNRRSFLLGGVGALSTPLLYQSTFASFKQVKSQLFSACTNHKNQHFISGLSSDGTLDFLIPVPERAHDSCYIPALNQVVFCGRSPSRRFYLVDVNNRQLLREIIAEKNRYLCGHASVDLNGYLYISENNTQDNSGVIGVYDTRRHYQKVKEYDSYGTEPHQLAVLPNQKMLVVANGGLIKEPGNSKKILNKANFESSVSYIDLASGGLIEKQISPHKGNSLRHITVHKTGEIFISAQSYHSDIQPLVYRHQVGDGLEAFEAEDYIWQSHQRYTASLSLSNNTLAVTSPRGNVVSFWGSESGKWLQQKKMQDVAGVVSHPHNDLFILASGTGCFRFYNSKGKLNYNACHQLYWDNHLASI
jgi:hypothetical protein